MYRRLYIGLGLLWAFSTYAGTAPMDSTSILERGFEIKDGSVHFPDGTQHPYVDVINGTAGLSWMEVEYCVEEGMRVWHTNTCCEGLEPALRGGAVLCDKIMAKKTSTTNDNPWWERLMNNTLFWVGLILPFLLLLIIAFGVKRRLRDKS